MWQGKKWGAAEKGISWQVNCGMYGLHRRLSVEGIHRLALGMEGTQEGWAWVA